MIGSLDGRYINLVESDRDAHDHLKSILLALRLRAKYHAAFRVFQPHILTPRLIGPRRPLDLIKLLSLSHYELDER